MVITRMKTMPLTIRGFTIRDAEGNYNIYLNDALSFEQNQKTYWHEMRHIRNRDFDRSEPAHIIEEGMG